jgi:hypothetical protein
MRMFWIGIFVGAGVVALGMLVGAALVVCK